MEKALADLKKMTGLDLVCSDGNAPGEDAAERLEMLAAAYREKYDKTNFIRNLLCGSISDTDIYAAALRFHIVGEERRVLYVVDCCDRRAEEAEQVLKHMFLRRSGDQCALFDDRRVVLFRTLYEKEGRNEILGLARTIVDMLNTEAMIRVRVGFGETAENLRGMPEAFRQAALAIEIGDTFYSNETVHEYSHLGIGRLIHDLPENTRRLYLREIFGGDGKEGFDSETLEIINTFFENDLNVTETARQLYIHRNTLLYRIEKIRQTTGYDLRKFDDAIDLKLALMISGSMEMKAGRTRQGTFSENALLNNR